MFSCGGRTTPTTHTNTERKMQDYYKINCSLYDCEWAEDGFMNVLFVTCFMAHHCDHRKQQDKMTFAFGQNLC